MENILQNLQEEFWFRELNPVELGRWIRQNRKERGLRLEDLADGSFSVATISNIERGIPRVRPEKIALLLEKLGLGRKEWGERRGSGDKVREDILFTAGIFLQAGYPVDALKELERVRRPDASEVPRYHLLKGECLQRMGNRSRAERCFQLAIRLSRGDSSEPKGNTEAAGFYGLGEIRGEEGDWKGALLFTESGLEAYDCRREETGLLFVLWRNRVRFLWKNGRKWDALDAIRRIWEKVESTFSLEGILSLYALRARVHLGLKQNEEAVRFAREGLERAAAEGRTVRIYELAGILAESALLEGDQEKAEGCFRLLARMEGAIPAAEGTKGWILLGKFHRLQRNWKEASESFRMAVCLGKEAERPDLLVRVYLEWGDSFQDQKDFREAVSCYKEGLKIIRDTSDSNLELAIWFRLAKAWEGRDEGEFLGCLKKVYKLEQKQREGAPDCRRRDPLQKNWNRAYEPRSHYG